MSATPPVVYPPVAVSRPTIVDLRRSERSETRLQHTNQDTNERSYPKSYRPKSYPKFEATGTAVAVATRNRRMIDRTRDAAATAA